MSGHTKGPWVTETNQWGVTSVKSANESDLAEWPIEYFIAEKIGGHIRGEDFTDFSEVQSNANLIAAAPDLLEAANQVMSWWSEHQYDTCGEYGEYNTYEDEPDFVKSARAAIAKARGEK